MVYGTLYKSVKAGESLRTRALFPAKFVEHYKLDVELSDPDSHFPSEFPAFAVPAFRYDNGDILTESIPIAFLLADLLPEKGTIYGDGSEADKARILMWMNTWNNEFSTKGVGSLFRMLIGKIPATKAAIEHASATLESKASFINDYLTHHTYLVGETVTLADLYGVTFLLRAITLLWGPNERAKYPAMMRWFNTIKEHPMFGGYFDTLEYAKEPAVPKVSA